MKTIGLIGGMSWESTTTYYQLINETIKKNLVGCIRLRFCFTVLTLRRLSTIRPAVTGLRVRES